MTTAAAQRALSPRPVPRSAGVRAAQPARRVLLAVAGLSPQIITETLYALARQKAPLPTEVHVLTTTTGAERVRLTLLSRSPGWFARLRRDCKLPAIRFGAAQIHVVRDASGKPLADIRTPAENDCLADQIVALVRDFTGDPSTSLHVSLAGGRKTMGYYAGYALSLYGRPQDRLSHVLVSGDFESHADFYYPSVRPRIIYDRDGRPLDTSAAEVQLAEIPFVRLRDRMSRPLLEGRLGFSATVAAMNAVHDAPCLVFHLEARRITAGTIPLTLPPREFAFYAWLAGQPGTLCPVAPERTAADQFLAIYRRLPTATATTERRLKPGMDANFFTESKSRLQRALAAAGVPEIYHIRRRTRSEGPAVFDLALPSSAIRFAEEESQ